VAPQLNFSELKKYFFRCPPRSPRSLADRFGDERNNFAVWRKKYIRFLLHNVPLPKKTPLGVEFLTPPQVLTEADIA